MTEQILFEDYLDFTNGDQDPYLTIPRCSNQQSTCDSPPVRNSSSSGNQANSVDAPDVYGSGSQSINWDFALFSTTDAGNIVSETTSFPLSSSAALMGTLTSHDFSLDHSTDWNAFSLPPSGPSPYLGNDSQLLTGGPIPFTTAGDLFDTMAISSGLGTLRDAHFSTPMVKGQMIQCSSTFFNTNIVQIIRRQVHLEATRLACLLRQNSLLHLDTQARKLVHLHQSPPRSRSAKPTQWLRAAIVKSASTR